MELRTSALTFVRGRGSATPSESRFLTFNDSVQQAVSSLTGSNFGFFPRKDHRLGLVKGRFVEQPTLRIVMSYSQQLS